jgi:Transposase DDE domain
MLDITHDIRMLKNSRLYHALFQWLGQSGAWRHQTHLTTCIWLVMAMIHTGSVNLTKWVGYLPCRGVFAQSIQRRIQRWLYNPRINVHRLYKPLIQAALAEWKDPTFFLALDTSLFWDEYCLVRLCVVYRGRALPVIWRVMAHPSASVSFEDYRQLLQQAVRRLPSDKRVVLLADRGFVHCDLMRLLTTQLGWHYRIRLKSNSWIWRSGKGWCQLKDFHFNRGEAWCWHQVRLHKKESYGLVHLIVGRNNVNGEFWAIVSDEPTTLQTFQEYGLRFDIEENFLDDQSNGWNIQRSQLRSVVALSRLWFILAVATLYLTAQGDAVVDAGKRRWIDTHWFRGNSYFRIGWEWVKASGVKGWEVIRSVRFTSHQDPLPAMASRKQDEQRRYRLEFQIQTFVYAPD